MAQATEHIDACPSCLKRYRLLLRVNAELVERDPDHEGLLAATPLDKKLAMLKSIQSVNAAAPLPAQSVKATVYEVLTRYAALAAPHLLKELRTGFDLMYAALEKVPLQGGSGHPLGAVAFADDGEPDELARACLAAYVLVSADLKGEDLAARTRELETRVRDVKLVRTIRELIANA
jgi:hypothetical protein